MLFISRGSGQYHLSDFIFFSSLSFPSVLSVPEQVLVDELKPLTWAPSSVETGNIFLIGKFFKNRILLSSGTRQQTQSPLLPVIFTAPEDSTPTRLKTNRQTKNDFIFHLNTKSPLDLICANTRHVVPPSPPAL